MGSQCCSEHDRCRYDDLKIEPRMQAFLTNEEV